MQRCEIDVPYWKSPDYKPRKHKSTVDIMGVSRIVEKAIVNMGLGVFNGSGYAFDTDTRDVGSINGEKVDKEGVAFNWKVFMWCFLCHVAFYMLFYRIL